jgi:hypothetical protein
MTDHDLFSDANLQAFAAAWYLALDQHAPTATCEALLVADGLRMIFPEKTLHGLGDFAAWYAGGTYGDGETAPGVMNIFFDESHTVLSVEVQRDGAGAVVDVIVGWQASWFVPPEARARRTSMNATQRWTVVPAPGRNPFGVAIESYNAMAKPFEYAPGFARL